MDDQESTAKQSQQQVQQTILETFLAEIESNGKHDVP